MTDAGAKQRILAVYRRRSWVKRDGARFVRSLERIGDHLYQTAEDLTVEVEDPEAVLAALVELYTRVVDTVCARADARAAEVAQRRRSHLHLVPVLRNTAAETTATEGVEDD
jgi:hypothetical protein